MKKTEIILFIFWIFSTTINITKAVHIDDGQYLLVARQIIENPVHPMIGTINWFDTTEPIHVSFIHPLLIPYIFAFVMSIFGENEFILHAIISFFTFLSIVFFYLLARIFSPRFALLTTGLFVLGPAFLPSQNLMMDIPVLSLWLAFFYMIFSSQKEINPTKKLVIAALVIGIVSLIKYSGVILIPFLFFWLIARRQVSYFWVFFIPIGILVLWSLFNIWDYGGIHMLDISRRSSGQIYGFFAKSRAWVLDIGAVVPFSFVFLPFILRPFRLFGFFICIILGILYSISYGYYSSEHFINFILRIFFFANGLFIFWLFLIILWDKRKEMSSECIILVLWFFGVSLYLISFLSLMAVRHVLLVLPPVFLLFSRYIFPKISKKVLYLGFLVSLFLGLALSVSDWLFADVYRTYAPFVSHYVRGLSENSPSRHYYYGGHWGWQWYANKEGFIGYDVWRTQFQTGDILVMPMTMQQYLNPLHSQHMYRLDFLEVPNHKLTLFRTVSDPLVAPRGFYASGDRYLPWIISTDPLEVFRIFKVD